MMILCLPTNGDAGIDDTICAHFGSAAFFCLYDSDSGEITVVSNRDVGHSHGNCHPTGKLGDYTIDAVICGGMGQRAIAALNAEGIKIYRAESESVRVTIEQIKSGSLTEVTPSGACHGHHHEGNHGQGKCCGRHDKDHS